RSLLDQYGSEPHERERERVQRAALSLCGGDLDELAELVQRAKLDYRDVLCWQSLAEGEADPIADQLDAALLTPNLTAERLVLLREAVPTVGRVAVLWNPANGLHRPQLAELERRARGVGLALLPVAVHRPAEFEAAFAGMRRERAEGLVALSSTLHRLQLRRLAALALDSRLASIC